MSQYVIACGVVGRDATRCSVTAVERDKTPSSGLKKKSSSYGSPRLPSDSFIGEPFSVGGVCSSQLDTLARHGEAWAWQLKWFAVNGGGEEKECCLKSGVGVR